MRACVCGCDATVAVEAAGDHVKAAVALNPKFVEDPVVRSVINAFVGNHQQAIADLSEILARGLALNTGGGMRQYVSHRLTPPLIYLHPSTN